MGERYRAIRNRRETSEFGQDASPEKYQAIRRPNMEEQDYSSCFKDVKEFEESRELEPCLDTFQQEKWEGLEEEERKAAISELADYNAEELGIEEPPDIDYYWGENANEYGGYSYERNRIFINEYNMNDSLEMVDTVSHEYRHCYQYERANKMETIQDMQFRDGFDNYIEPDTDYDAYNNQYVEVDAREYAKSIVDQVKEKQDGLSESTYEALVKEVLLSKDEWENCFIDEDFEFKEERYENDTE